MMMTDLIRFRNAGWEIFQVKFNSMPPKTGNLTLYSTFNQETSKSEVNYPFPVEIDIWMPPKKGVL